MKNNKKIKKIKKMGFTLIELVAVILVLAIIALIAIPTIGNIIEESKKNSFKTSVQNIVTAANDQCEVERLNGGITTKSYSFNSTGSTPKINVKGKLPTSGTMTLDDECNVSVNVSNDRYTATMNDGVIVITDNVSKKYEDYVTGKTSQVEAIYFDPKDNNMCTTYVAANSAAGTNTGCMKWYVIKDSDSNSDKVEVILDHNISNLTSYDDYETTLTSDTTGWNSGLNVRLIDPDYVANITGASKSDTLNWKQSSTTSNPFILDGNNTDGWVNVIANTKGASNYSWLFDYTSGCESYGCNTNGAASNVGYWTAKRSARDEASAWAITRDGMLADEMSDSDFEYGIRPVITITKKKLS